jgi:hypothetical protein
LTKDPNGLWKSNNAYIRQYYRQREVTQIHDHGFHHFAAGFDQTMGYDIRDIHRQFGRPAFEKQFEEPAHDDEAAAVGGGDWEEDRDDGAAVGGGDWEQGRKDQDDPGPGNVPAGDAPQPGGEDGPDQANGGQGVQGQPDSTESQASADQRSDNFS